MIRVEVGPQLSKIGYRHRGLPFPFSIPEFGIQGQSTEPLLDACRLLRERGVDSKRQIGLFSPGEQDYRLRTTVGYGAQWTVAEPDHGTMRFARFRQHDPESLDRLRDAED